MRGGCAVMLQPATLSTTAAVQHVQAGSKKTLAANLGFVSRFGIMAVLLQQIASEAP
jgi:hypothetical protein